VRSKSIVAPQLTSTPRQTSSVIVNVPSPLSTGFPIGDMYDKLHAFEVGDEDKMKIGPIEFYTSYVS